MVVVAGTRVLFSGFLELTEVAIFGGLVGKTSLTLLLQLLNLPLSQIPMHLLLDVVLLNHVIGARLIGILKYCICSE